MSYAPCSLSHILNVLISGLLLGIYLPSEARKISSKQENIQPTTVTREFRGVWIATVANIDFPSKPGLTTQEQKAELIALLDKAVEINLNVVVFQIRPISDALYESKLEPWSEFLSGEMGKPPQPFYDPLEFAIKEAHKRGLELHAWFNPYRAHHPETISPISDNHISKTRPDFVKPYGKYLWLDPGEKQVQDYSLKVILDVVRRYDIDGVHIDDYFYPYPQRDEDGQRIDFPDEISWGKYLASGGKLNRGNWRRENINTFVRRMYRSVKKEKPWVKVGISPFGVWQPGYPARITNIDNGRTFNAYQQIYADSRKWLQSGWLDYLSPQLYWKIEQTAQSYPVLLNWWFSQNTKKRSIFPGIYTSRIRNEDDIGWDANEIAYQIRTTRGFTKSSGNIHFSMKALMQNRKGIADILASEIYAKPALVPATPWLNQTQPKKPQLKIIQDKKIGQIRLYWQAKGKQKIKSWVVQLNKADKWNTKILPGSKNSYFVNDITIENIAISGVSRYGIQGKTALSTVEE